jgi:hypothetical protein
MFLPYHEISPGSMYPVCQSARVNRRTRDQYLPCTNSEVLSWELEGTFSPSQFTISFNRWNKFRVKSIDGRARQLRTRSQLCHF